MYQEWLVTVFSSLSKGDKMQISVTPESKKKVPYKTLFLALIYIDNRYGLEISC